MKMGGGGGGEKEEKKREEEEEYRVYVRKGKKNGFRTGGWDKQAMITRKRRKDKHQWQGRTPASSEVKNKPKKLVRKKG